METALGFHGRSSGADTSRYEAALQVASYPISTDTGLMLLLGFKEEKQNNKNMLT